MSQTIPVYGTVIEWSDDGAAWAKIPRLEGVALPKVSQDYREITDLDSPDHFREWTKGFKDGGEVTLTCKYFKETWVAASDKAALPGPVHFRATLVADDDQSAGDQFTWQAHVTPSIPDGDKDGDMMIELALRTTGPLGWTQGAAA